ncbi:Cof-type HAD-IIB family hydrolase [Dysgonomonas sp. HGC4]|uniref:Cof-type HAD-IIB family hydrolase n=1 Tax=Dysgonomonas sp. HGC4 TaxID=1658009 RepID=UPI000681B211|nr:Cof-type HAD-IIB family hydrolase [Dysgonomonas sp. HGC4]MBD8349394.1 Cof-type HAD-IIB family hydrolase [Dysgonomonas sp. HGC4]
MIKAIFFDIDGTLKSFKTHSIPQSTIDAINEVKEKGIKVFIATGRYFKQIGDLNGLVFDGLITLNGAHCINSENETIFTNPIPRENIDALLRYHSEKFLFPSIFITEKKELINCIDENVREISRLVDVPLSPLGILDEIDKEEVLQIDAFINKEQEQEILDTVLTHCDASRWNPLFADVNVRGNSKRTGIDKFLEYYKLDFSETMAFGDGGNDVQMLKHVAIGVAMGNAGDEAKQAADYITDSADDDGIQNALKHFGVI